MSLQFLKPISLAFLLSFGFALSGQSGIQYWNTEDGLSNDWISQITQDENGYIWLATQYGLNRFDGYEFKSYQYEPNNTNSLSGNWSYSMAKDTAGIIWTGTYLAGVDAFNPTTGATQRYEIRAKDSSLVTTIRFIACDADQTIWLSSSAGLFAKKHTQNDFEQVFDQGVSDFQLSHSKKIYILSNQTIYLLDVSSRQIQAILQFDHADIRRLFVDDAGILWALGTNQLFKITFQNGQWAYETVTFDNLTHSTYFYNSPIYEDRQNQLWIGGQESISVIDKQRKTAKKIPYSEIFPKGSPQGEALSFFEDQHDNFWIGTTKGLLLKSPFTQRFALTKRIPHLDQFTNIREIVQLEEFIWFANPDGLYRINRLQPEVPPLKVSSKRIFALLPSDDGYLYAGGNQFFQINPKTLAVKEFSKTMNPNGFRGGFIWSLAADKSGKIWIGARSLLQRFDPKTETFDYFDDQEIPSLKAVPTQDLLIDKLGRLWAGSLSKGLFLLENPHEVSQIEDVQFKQFDYGEHNQNSLSSSMVLFLTEGKDGAIWVGTDGGLNRINPTDFSVKRFLKKDGLKDEKIMSLVADEQGNMWGSTIGHGIFKLDKTTENFTFFNRKDGLTSNNFLLSAVLKNKEGTLFFGSDNQTQIIEPTLINKVNKPTIQYIFTELAIADNQLIEKDKRIDLHHKKTITLPHNFQAFTIHYSTLNFYQASKTTYQYQLMGIHDDWLSNGNNRSLSFTGLPVGNYILKVKAINPDLNFEQSAIALSLVISPPWWRTNWAYALYALLLLSSLYFWYQFQLNRQLEKAETQRLQELDALKTRFFTNITHELRTPLTVILGMANQLLTFSKKEVKSKANLIERNGRQLLNLINEILDLSKLEAGKLPINWVHGDLLLYVNYLLESFQSLANSKRIDLHFLPEIAELWMDYDEEKIKQIISNLLSNALQYTPAEGNVYLQIQTIANQAILTVRDTGKGIAENHLPHVFDRFYQVSDKEGGTGIGLALTKELVHLLNGEIEVKSQVGKGSSFRLSLPISKGENIPLAINREVTKIADNPNNIRQPSDASLPLLLLVEDNEDVLHYLVECLKADYRLVLSKNGAEGIELALSDIPDLIISDVMMPEKDGFELCQTLKTDKKTSHIPIILLTAKADTTSRITGLEFGADAYLSKPFEPKELAVRVRKLLELRQQLQQRYQDQEFWENPKSNPTNQEDAFVLKVRQIVEEHLNDSHFGIPQLCQKLGISRVHLHRKLKALTNQSTTHFINQIRLQKAKLLLKNSELNISEIAYEVGFGDPAYFSRLYSETFGESPSVTRK